ncbi:MAG: hypothetical protein IIA67_03000 [Planctomycetes bacterium]|nr:hypothetical protein [Planctomycetota bacterium]
MFGPTSRVLTRTVLLWLFAAVCAAAPASPDAKQPKVSKAEQALQSTTEFNFVETPLQKAIAFFADRHKVNLQFDNKALEDVGIATNTPVSMCAKGISLRSALRLILRESELTFFVADGLIIITTPEEAETQLSTKLYAVANLVTLDESVPYSPDNVDFDPLIELIEMIVQPDSWDANGGPGSIDGFEKSAALVVSQTYETHREISLTLAALERLHKAHRSATETARLEREAADQATSKAAEKISGADRRLVVRVYRVGTIEHLLPRPAKAGKKKPPKTPAARDYATAQRSVDALAQLIEKTIAADRWDKPHVIHGIPGTLTVRHIWRVHLEITKLLSKMQLLEGHMTLLAEAHPLGSRKATMDSFGLQAESASVAKIRRALDEPTAVDFQETSLKEVARYLSDRHKIEIHFDRRALAEVGIGSDTLVTRRLKGVSLRSTLGLILRDIELISMIHNEVLLITTPEEEEIRLVTRFYPVNDLVAGEGPANDHFIDFDPLVELIEASIEPHTWDVNGGPGVIDASEKAVALVASQTEKVHEKIADLLKKLREVRDRQFKDGAVRKNNKGAATQHDLRAYRLLVKVGEPKKAAPPLPGNVGGNFGTSVERFPFDVLTSLPDAAALDTLTRRLSTMVTDTIEPAGWNADSTRTIHTVAGYLVIRHNPAVHARVKELLSRCDVLRDVPSGSYWRDVLRRGVPVLGGG